MLTALQEAMAGHTTADLLPLLHHRFWEIRKAAAYALGRKPDLRQEAIRTALAAALVKEMDIYVLAELIPAVASAGAASATERLRTLLKHEQPFTRQAAIVALAQLRDRGAVPQLVAAAEDPDLQVSVAALGALARLGDAAGLPVLRRFAREKPPVRQAVAVQGLAMVGDAESIPYFRQLLRGGNDQLAVAAARALGQLRAEAAITDLIAAWESNRSGLRIAIEPALAQLDAKKVLRRLLALPGGPGEREQARRRLVATHFHRAEKELPDVKATLPAGTLPSLAGALTAAIPADDRHHAGRQVRPNQLRRIQQLDAWYFVQGDYGQEGHVFAVRR